MEAHQEGRGIIFMEEMKRGQIKGKRTKRRRPSSALTLTLSSNTSSSSSMGSENEGLVNHSGFFQMPSTTNIEFTNILQDNNNENDQDMANCLMLLSHGHPVLTPSPLKMVVPRSYVYECKTCDRGFASFQALGGHRASHNKPHKDVHELSKNRTSLSISPNKALLCNPSGSTKRSKVHECSICGSDFTSGQALGGHMRRHRSMTMTTSTIATSSNSSYGCHESKKHKTILPLDLNLPAPTEDDHKETTNAFEANNQIIVFSTPSLG